MIRDLSDLKQLCGCGHIWYEHNHIDVDDSSCDNCNCKGYNENEQARWLYFNKEIIAIGICVGIIIFGLMSI